MHLNKIIISFLFLFFLISGELKSQAISGIKVIGDDGDYTTIKDAVEVLNSHGVDGSVEFQIKNGTYKERFTINEIIGQTTNDSVVFKAQSGDYNDVIVQLDASERSENHLVKLNGCERVIFKSMTFQTQSDSFSTQFILTQGASYNKIEDCVFKASLNAIPVEEHLEDGIVIYNKEAGSKEEFNEFIGNTIYGGVIGISIQSAADSLEEGNTIIRNTLHGQKKQSVEIVHNAKGFFNENTIRYEGDGVAVTMEITNEYEVQRNRIYSNGVRALFISDFVAQNPIPIPNFDSFIGLKVYNNMISCPNGSAFEGNHINGIFLGHNTLFNNDMVYTLILDTSKNFYSLYNLLVNNSEFGVIRVKLDEDGAEFSSFGSDYNGIFSGNGHVGMFQENVYTSIDEWKLNENNPDPNSSFGSVKFQNDSFDLALICGADPSLRYQGTPPVWPFFDQDIDGTPRDNNNFWFGAAEMINPMDSVFGYVTDETDTLKSGMVKIFTKRTNKMSLKEVTQFNIQSNGQYVLSDMPYAENYWVKIIPDKNDNPNCIASYHTGHLRWDAENQEPFTLEEFCLKTLNNIYPRKLDVLSSGNYSIQGNVSQTGGTNKLEGNDPIPGLDVILDKIPPSNTVAVTETDALGNYTFSNLPEGEYVITVDYQGLPADTLYKIKLNEGNDSLVNLDYCVDTTSQIEGCASFGVGKEEFLLDDIRLFPNPFNEQLVISGLNQEFDVHIFDARGREVTSMLNQRLKTSIPTVGFEFGLYLITVKTATGSHTFKVLK